MKSLISEKNTFFDLLKALNQLGNLVLCNKDTGKLVTVSHIESPVMYANAIKINGFESTEDTVGGSPEIDFLVSEDSAYPYRCHIRGVSDKQAIQCEGKQISMVAPNLQTYFVHLADQFLEDVRLNYTRLSC